MKTLFEELLEKGLSARRLTVELAITIPYVCIIDKLIRTDISLISWLKSKGIEEER